MVIIFSGHNIRALIAFIRTLENHNISYLIIAASERDPIIFTSYSNKVKFICKNNNLMIDELISIIKEIKSEETRAFIAPSTEFLNRFLLKNRKAFEELNCIIPLVDEKLYISLSDKESFSNICEQYGIKCPNRLSNIDGNTRIVAKPKKYVSSDGGIYNPVFIKGEKEYLDFCSCHNIDDFYFQEYLADSESYYLLFYFSKSGKIYSFSQKNICQQGGGKSIIAAIGADYHKDKNIVEPYINMLRDKLFFGLIMIEVRRVGNCDYMIEANPRFWGPSQLFVDAGINFFEYMLEDYGLFEDKTILKKNMKECFYFWSGGLASSINDDIHWFDNGKMFFEHNNRKFIESDIYDRPDTRDIFLIEQLKSLYNETSKHSNYQILPRALEKYIEIKELNIKSRMEKERFNYISKNISIQNKKILDIGGNTGYFSFEALNSGASHIDYYEGNKIHAKFVDLASSLLKCKDFISVYNDYFLFDNTHLKWDIIFNLNVIHHLGDDFGNVDSVCEAKKTMINSINALAYSAKYMAFQMGYNWMGNIQKCLFENGTKEEMINFIKTESKEYWDIKNIGIAEETHNGITFKDLDEVNILRNDHLGEFLNRPIFIMKSLKYN